METIDSNNNKGTESKYVATADIKDLDPCIFDNKRNPATNKGCTEFYKNIETVEDNRFKVPNDPIVHLYFASVGALLLFILHRYIDKK